MAPVRTTSDLVRDLHARRGTLSPSHERLAQYLLENLEESAFLTGAELAGRVGVNESTVARFATTLGLSGYPALKEVLREGVRQKVGLVDRFDALLENDATGSDLLSRATKLDLENLATTRAGVTDETWSAITEALSTAETVFVVGARKSYAATYLLGYLLGLVRERVVTTGPGVPGFPDALSALGASDVLVAITIRRYTADTVRAAHFARDRQATAVALTDDISSPLVECCQHALFVSTQGPSVLRSTTGLVSLVQALVAEVAQRRGPRTREQLLHEEALLDHFDTYFLGPGAVAGS